MDKAAGNVEPSVSERARASIATAPGALPLLGHLVQLVRNPLGFVTSLPEHGDLVRIRLGPFQVIVVCDPALTRHVLLNDKIFDKGGPLFDRVREAVGDGLASCPYSEHRRQRRLLQPAFNSSRLGRYAQVMTAKLADMTDSWRDGQVLDVSAVMQTSTARVIVETMFSDTLPAPVLSQAIDDVNALFAGVFQRMLMPPPLDRLPTPGNRRYHQVRARLRHTLGGIIANRRKSSTDRGDLLSALLAARDPDPASGRQDLSDAEVYEQVVAFFTAGTETTAATLTWALHLLALHPDIEERLHAEVDTVLNGSVASCEHLPKLALTSRILTETLRLYPPGWLLTRSAVVDTHLGGHLIPAKTILAYSAYLIHHRPDVYKDPERFDPDRWDSTRRAPPPHDAFIPFATGPRKCIGDQFGMIAATLGLATIAARWRLCSLPGHPVRAIADSTLHPQGLRMRVAARKKADEPQSRTA
jgi:pentalenene oxygenase